MNIAHDKLSLSVQHPLRWTDTMIPHPPLSCLVSDGRDRVSERRLLLCTHGSPLHKRTPGLPIWTLRTTPSVQARLWVYSLPAVAAAGETRPSVGPSARPPVRVCV